MVSISSATRQTLPRRTRLSHIASEADGPLTYHLHHLHAGIVPAAPSEVRPGHDRRYAIDINKISTELGWQPKETFATGIRKTVTWYLENQEWIRDVTSGAYRDWIEKNYQDRKV